MTRAFVQPRATRAKASEPSLYDQRLTGPPHVVPRSPAAAVAAAGTGAAATPWPPDGGGGGGGGGDVGGGGGGGDVGPLDVGGGDVGGGATVGGPSAGATTSEGAAPSTRGSPAQPSKKTQGPSRIPRSVSLSGLAARAGPHAR